MRGIHARRLHPIRVSYLWAGLRTTLWSWHGRARRRAAADEWLLWGAVPRATSELLAWRAEELASAHSRDSLVKLCRRFVHELDNPRCRAYAVNRPAMRAHRDLLVRLADQLAAQKRPVSPRGVILAQRVLGDGAGPLFDPARADELGPALVDALQALEEPDTRERQISRSGATPPPESH
jgi:hypothetical protein